MDYRVGNTCVSHLTGSACCKDMSLHRGQRPPAAVKQISMTRAPSVTKLEQGLVVTGSEMKCLVP